MANKLMKEKNGRKREEIEREWRERREEIKKWQKGKGRKWNGAVVPKLGVNYPLGVV